MCCGMKLVADLRLLSILISLFVRIPVSEAVLDYLIGELQYCVCACVERNYVLLPLIGLIMSMASFSSIVNLCYEMRPISGRGSIYM